MRLQPIHRLPLPGGTTASLLLHQLAEAGSSMEALAAGNVASVAELEQRILEAREHIEAFQLLGRIATDVTVPRRVWGRVAAALDDLTEGRFELARADVDWAGGRLERHFRSRMMGGLPGS